MRQYSVKWKCKRWLGHLKQYSLVSVVFLPAPSSPAEQQGTWACSRRPACAAARLAHGEPAQVSARGTALCGGTAFASIVFRDS